MQESGDIGALGVLGALGALRASTEAAGKAKDEADSRAQTATRSILATQQTLRQFLDQIVALKRRVKIEQERGPKSEKELKRIQQKVRAAKGRLEATLTASKEHMDDFAVKSAEFRQTAQRNRADILEGLKSKDDLRAEFISLTQAEKAKRGHLSELSARLEIAQHATALQLEKQENKAATLEEAKRELKCGCYDHTALVVLVDFILQETFSSRRVVCVRTPCCCCVLCHHLNSACLTE
jgi:chromosome segregation ATPase